MREILFKAKRKNWRELPKEKWWVEGFYFCMSHNDERNHIHHFILPLGTDLSLGTQIEKIQVEVNPETICQYTGLKDKNGRKIWENDILMGHENKNDLVKVVFGEFSVINTETLEKIDNVIGWRYEVIPTDALSKCEPFYLSMPLTKEYVKRCEFEVVGNIFDNPK